LAEAVTANFEKGDRAIVVGRMSSRSYEDAKGDKKTVWELAAEDVGISVKPPKTQGRGTRPETPEEPF
jgi:single-strand DNA-binding protein